MRIEVTGAIQLKSTEELCSRNDRQGGIRALTYHAISREHPSAPYTVSIQQFEEQLDLVAGLSGMDDCVRRDVLVTFDDGHFSNFELALPALERHSIRAVFFVVANFISSRTDFMTWAQLREVAALGHEVQSHSWSHLLLTHCSDENLLEELTRSRQEIEQRLGKQVEALGVPGGRWDLRVLRAAKSAGYRRVYVSDPWISSKKLGGIELSGRLTIKNHMKALLLKSLIKGGGSYSRLFHAQYRAKEVFRRVVGDSTYMWVWSRLSKRGLARKSVLIEDPSWKG
jgi:peptidoglycan/xylan/chitin deacetylase (PgdA/CDA1 family)